MNPLKKYTDPVAFANLHVLDNIPIFLDEIRKNYHSKIAIKTSNQEVSYAQLYLDVQKIGTRLQELNLPKGANIGLICNNNYQFVQTVLGIMGYGYTAVLLPAHLDEKGIYGCSLKYNIEALFFEDCFQEKIIFTSNILTTISFVSLLSCQRNENPALDYTINKEQPACIIMTGGTTGKSKGAILSHRALLQGTYNGAMGFQKVYDQKYFSLMPLTHVFGLIRNLLSVLFTGSLIYFPESMKTIFKEFPLANPTTIILVPALAELFLNIIKKQGQHVLGENLETIVCGAAPVPPYLISEYKKLNINLFPGYGLTESANIISGNPEIITKPTSVGFIYPEQEIKVVDGELWFRGANLMSGYYNEPEETARSYEDGWFKTGDLVRFDEDGFLYIIGRIKDIIILANGENISPAEIENKFNELPFIQDSLVYEDTSSLGTQILTLEVFLRQNIIAQLQVDDVSLFAETEIQKVNQQLYPYQRVSKIIIRETDFPRTQAMKIIRPKKVL